LVGLYVKIMFLTLLVKKTEATQLEFLNIKYL